METQHPLIFRHLLPGTWLEVTTERSVYTLRYLRSDQGEIYVSLKGGEMEQFQAYQVCRYLGCRSEKGETIWTDRLVPRMTMQFYSSAFDELLHTTPVSGWRAVGLQLPQDKVKLRLRFVDVVPASGHETGSTVMMTRRIQYPLEVMGQVDLSIQAQAIIGRFLESERQALMDYWDEAKQRGKAALAYRALQYALRYTPPQQPISQLHWLTLYTWAQLTRMPLVLPPDR